MKTKDIKNNSLDELRSALNDARKKLLELKFEMASAGLKNPHDVRNTRRDIARLLTLINEKQDDKQ